MDPLDRQAKLVDMQVKILDAVGKFNKTMAETEKLNAEAMEIHLRNAVRAKISNQLDIALKALNRHKREVDEEKERILADRKQCAVFITGFKPPSLSMLSATFAAFNRGLGRLDAESVGNFFAVGVSSEHRNEANFVAVSGSVTVHDAPDEVENLGLLMDWISANGVFFKKARKAHMLLLASYPVLTKGIDARLKELDDRLSKVSQADIQEVEALVRLAGVPLSAVKSPAGAP